MLLLLLALISVTLTFLTVLPSRRFLVPALFTFFATLPVAEFAPLVLVLELLTLIYAVPSAWLVFPHFVVVGASAAVLGSAILLARHYLQAIPDGAPYEERWRHVLPLVFSGYGVKIVPNIVFDGEHKLKLDVFTQVDEPAVKSPAIIYVHGGGWVLGYRKFQGRPFMVRMAQRGFVCFAIDYRLSPRATFPDHIIDVKRAIAWVREHAEDYNVDPDQILIAGNSAGGHLAALAALTPKMLQFQPGFEEARTDVQGCLSFYGVYDLRNVLERWPHRGLELLWRFVIMKQPADTGAEAYRLASPAAHLENSKLQPPPFFMVHGSYDTLVPLAEATAFKAKLEPLTQVDLVVIPGAQHAFELGVSPRARAALHAAERFALSITEAHRAKTAAPLTRVRSRA